MHALRLDRRHAFLDLQRAFDEQVRRADDGRALLGEQIGPHDDVGDAGFILEREEHESLCGARPLPRDDGAGHAHAPAVPAARQIDRAQHAAQRQLRRRSASGCGPMVRLVPA